MIFPFSKIVGAVLAPANLFVLLLVGATLTSFSREEKAARAGRFVVFFLALLALTCTVLPVGEWALSPLENKFRQNLPEKADGIVMLTGDENPGLSEARNLPISGFASQRYLRLAHLAKKYPSAKIVIAGTTEPLFPSQKLTTREISESFLRDMGIPLSRVIFEEKSRTTHENAVYTAKLVKPQKDEKWILLTSAFHLPRSYLCFLNESWKTIPIASDFVTVPVVKPVLEFDFATHLRFLGMAAHEYIGLASYWMAGWIERPW